MEGGVEGGMEGGVEGGEWAGAEQEGVAAVAASAALLDEQVSEAVAPCLAHPHLGSSATSAAPPPYVGNWRMLYAGESDIPPPSSLATLVAVDTYLVHFGGFNTVADADMSELHVSNLWMPLQSDVFSHCE